MKRFLTLFFSLLSGYALAQNSPATITARIENVKSDSVLIAFSPLSDPKKEEIDTVKLQNGVLTYRFGAKELHQAFIIPFDLVHTFKNGITYPLPGSRIRFFIGPGDAIDISARADGKIVTYSTKGNRLSEQFSSSNVDKTEIFVSRYLFESQYNEKSRSENTAEEQKQYMAKRGANNLAYQNANVSYAIGHLDQEVSALLLLEVSNRDTVALLFPKLSPKVKSSPYGLALGKLVSGWYQTKTGQKLPPLESLTIDGHPFKLGDYAGKFVLLDFWGSWCSPCIQEIPALKSFYRTNASKLQLVGVICKDKKQSAMAVIKKYGTDWPQLYAENDGFASLFGISAYPTKILLDPKGTVVQVFTGTNDKMLDQISGLINK